MKKRWSVVLLVLVFLAGVSILCYPAASDWWNCKVQTRAIANYEALLKTLGERDFSDEFQRADEYNRLLRELSNPLSDYEEVEGYEDILNVGGAGILGTLIIPALQLKLPVYHGTSEGVLQVAVGHLQGSSLPVGGAGTHAVLSAHRGLPSAKLFSYLDRLKEGDLFQIRVLDRTLTYCVDQICTVLPSETEELKIMEDGDYCTLLTCTPYGINSHRLLVRGCAVPAD